MNKATRFYGLDVHKETIAVAVAEPTGEVRSLGTIPNNAEAIAKLVKRQGDRETLSFCYEAGPTGFVLYWQMVKLGVNCVVVAPTLIPVKSGDRVKTDRRDAEKLARCFRGGDLTPVWVPTPAHEALRDLVRARESAKKDQRRARQRLLKFLLRRGVSSPAKMRLWTEKHRAWVWSVSFELAPQQATLEDYASEVDHARARVERLERTLDAAIETAPASMRAVIDALQSMRGVSQLAAVTIVAEVGELSRFEHPRQLMGYSGAVPSEQSSGGATRRGGITKTGNSHLRRVLVESAWAYRHRPRVIGKLRKRQEGMSDAVKAIAWKAQERLCGRYKKLAAKSMMQQQVVTAVAREMLGFIWAIGVEVERSAAAKPLTTKAVESAA
jgi:transposase